MSPLHRLVVNFATEPLSDRLQRAILPARQGAWDTQAVLSPFRLAQAGRLVFVTARSLRVTGRAAHHPCAQRALRQWFTKLGSSTVWAELFGVMGMTDASHPHFHPPPPD